MEDDCSLMFRAAPKARRKVGAKYQSKSCRGLRYRICSIYSQRLKISTNNLKFYQYIKISIFIMLIFAPLN